MTTAGKTKCQKRQEEGLSTSGLHAKDEVVEVWLLIALTGYVPQ